MTPKKGASQKDIQEGLKKWNAAQEEMKNAKPSNKVVSKKAVEVTRGAVDKKESMFREYPPVPSPKTPVKVAATSFKGNDTPTKPPVKGIDTPVKALNTSATGPSKGGVISKAVEAVKTFTPVMKPADTTIKTPTTAVKKPDVAPSVKSTGMPRPAPSTPPAEKGLGAVAPSATAGINAVQNVVKKAVPQVAQATKMPAPAANQVFKPKTMKKGGKTSCYSSGGSTSGASKRGDGIAIRGKTRGKIC